MKIIKEVVEHSGRFLEFVKTFYTDTKGGNAKWEWCRRPDGTRAVVIAAIAKVKTLGLSGSGYKSLLVVTKEFRVPIGGYEYGFPAGLIDKGETPEQAAIRELSEETGLTVVNFIDISPPLASSAGITDEKIHMVYLNATGTPNTDKLESSEDITTMLLSREEVKELIARTDITIGKSAYVVMRTFVNTGDI